jgi:isopenicillin-N N-acyltransferase-like protein
MYDLPSIIVSGSPQAMGQQQGEAFGDHIRSLVAHRMQENVNYFAERGITDGHHRLVDIGRHMNDMLADWDPEGHQEHAGIADAAGVDPAELLVLLNMTDTRDLICFATGVEDEGCTAMLLPANRSRTGQVIAAQTWDLNRGDLQHVVCVQRRPDDGPTTASVSVAGGPTLIGLNEHGVWVGTTNLKTLQVQPGIGYMSLLHRAIRQRTHADAAALIEDATRMAAHTYWLADEHGGVELECTSTTVVRRPLGDAPIVQTNHCLAESHRDAEPPSDSSLHRCATATALLADGQFDVEGIRTVLADRSEGALSISRHPEDGEATSTNACAIGVPATRTFHTCRGPADHGQWIEIPLG